MNKPGLDAITNVLFVDDDEDIRFVAVRALEATSSWKVKACPSGEAALISAEQSTPDLVLLDVMMPGLDGVATMRKLRESGCRAAIIMMTARRGEQEHEEYRAAGALGVITKPFDPVSLVQTVLGVVASTQNSPESPVQAASAASGGSKESLSARYLKSLATRMGSLDALFAEPVATEEARAEALKLAHNLVGSAATFGFPSLTGVAVRLEESLLAGGGEAEWGTTTDCYSDLVRAVVALET